MKNNRKSQELSKNEWRLLFYARNFMMSQIQIYSQHHRSHTHSRTATRIDHIEDSPIGTNGTIEIRRDFGNKMY